MAIIKKKKLRAMNAGDLEEKLKEIIVELNRERSQAQRPKNTAKVRELKKLRSRIGNYLNSKAVAA